MERKQLQTELDMALFQSYTMAMAAHYCHS